MYGFPQHVTSYISCNTLITAIHEIEQMFEPGFMRPHHIFNKDMNAPPGSIGMPQLHFIWLCADGGRYQPQTDGLLASERTKASGATTPPSCSTETLSNPFGSKLLLMSRFVIYSGALDCDDVSD